MFAVLPNDAHGGPNCFWPSPDAVPDLLEAEDVAHRLKVSIQTVNRERREGRLHAVKIRGTFRFKPEDVVAYINGQSTRNA